MQGEAKESHVAERRSGAAEEARLRILVERMVREGESEAAIAKAVREASLG
jgi:hypothetical protein